MLRRSRIISLGTAAGASIVTIGLIAGVAQSHHATTSSTNSGTTSSNQSSNTNKSSTSGSGSVGTVQQAPVQQQPVGGSHGS